MRTVGCTRSKCQAFLFDPESFSQADTEEQLISDLEISPEEASQRLSKANLF